MHKIREQIGSAGLIVAIIALIAALGGGAYAATSSGGGKEATVSAGKQGPRGKQGKPGKPGAPGAPGAKGDTGTAGPAGAVGSAGPQGKEGPQGTPGVGVKVAAAGIGNCEGRGGAVIEKAETGAPKLEACNGKEGLEGPEGPPGPPLIPSGALGSGETETGGWAFTGTAADTGGVFAVISFPVSLSAGLGEDEEVHYVTQEEQVLSTQPAACAGGTMNTPKAEPGQLCVYESSAGDIVNATFGAIFKLSNGEALGASKTGALVHFNVTGVAHGSGSWAVTGA